MAAIVASAGNASNGFISAVLIRPVVIRPVAIRPGTERQALTLCSILDRRIARNKRGFEQVPVNADYKGRKGPEEEK